MSEAIEVHLLDAARLLVSNRETGELVLHFRDMNGADFYFGLSLSDGASLVSQWRADIADVAMSLDSGGEITGSTETPPRLVN